MAAKRDCLCDCMRKDVSSAGYKYLASKMKKEEEDPSAKQEAQDEFLLQLDELENLLSKHAGPYLVGWVQFPSLWLQLWLWGTLLGCDPTPRLRPLHPLSPLHPSPPPSLLLSFLMHLSMFSLACTVVLMTCAFCISHGCLVCFPM